jgi:hypothetical protein
VGSQLSNFRFGLPVETIVSEFSSRYFVYLNGLRCFKFLVRNHESLISWSRLGRFNTFNMARVTGFNGNDVVNTLGVI